MLDERDGISPAAPASRHLQARVLAWAALSCLPAAALALVIDVPVARYFLLKKFPGDLESVLAVSELFAHGAGILLIGLTIAVLDRGRLGGRVVVTALSAGAVALVAKCLVGRWRPKRFDFDGNVWDTFTGWLPAWTHGDASEIFNRGLQSMPSGHTASAIALACILVSHYPRGRWLFPIFAVMVMLQRVSIGAHFVSDTLVAASVGFVTAAVFLDPRLLGHFLAERDPGNEQQRDLLPLSAIYSGRMTVGDASEPLPRIPLEMFADESGRHSATDRIGADGVSRGRHR